MSVCKVCHRDIGFFTREHECSFCGSIICHDCAIKFHLDSDSKKIAFDYSAKSITKIHRGWSSAYAYACPSCYTNYQSKTYAMEASAINIGASNVRLYSARYQGKLPLHTQEMQIKTDFYRDRDDAEYALKNIAAHLGCRCVIQVRFNKDTDLEEGNNGGTHYYTIFQYEGIGVK